MDKPKAIFLMGPTAAGKTDLAVRLAQALPCEIISVDSALVYRGMDIGTAKPGPEILAVAPHRLIDIRDPADPYSAAMFREEALREMADIVDAGRVPLLVGGTGLYFRALEHGFSELPQADQATRDRLDAKANDIGWAAMHEWLAEVDPPSAARLHPNDSQRIQRALEIYTLTGEPMSAQLGARQGDAFTYTVMKVVLAPPDRSRLRDRISARFAAMLAAGLVAEVQALYDRGDLDPGLSSVRCVGYRQIWAMLEGEIDTAEMIRRAEAATRQLAKRQYTWFRSDTENVWYDSEDEQTVAQVFDEIDRFCAA